MTTQRYGIALIGAGAIARLHAAAIADIPHATLVAVCDKYEAACRTFADAVHATGGRVDWTTDLDALLARGDVDVVHVCTPSGTHAEPAIRAARAGKHLVVEKPLDVTVARARQIIAAARANGVKLTGIFPYRFRQGILAARQAVEQGRLGRVTLADAYVKWYRAQDYYRGWHGTWALDGGGALINQSIHTIDVVQWLAGPVRTVYGQIATLNHEMEAEDTASAVLAFESGALGVIQGATSCWPGDPARCEIHGTRGTIVLEEGRIAAWKLADSTPAEEAALTALETSDGRSFSDPTALSHIPHQRQIEDLLEAIEQDREPRVTGEDALQAVEIIRGIYLSAQRGERVTLPLADQDA